MPIYISLLRGINVSGQKKIKMPELKALYESLGLENVATYIQSGNVVFSTESNTESEVSAKIESAIQDELGYQVKVILRTPDQLKSIIDNNPFSDGDLSKLHVTFLADPTDASEHAKLDVAKVGEEAYEICGSHVYVYCPQGYGRTKLNNNLIERALATPATTRNWNSVNKLLLMADESA